MNRKLLFCAALALLIAPGCGGGGGGNGGSNPPPSGPTSEQRLALTNVSNVFTSAKLVGELTADAAGSSQLPASTCPIVTKTGSVTKFNFGSGCSGPATDGETVAGALLVDTDAHSITFQSLTVSGKTITGAASYSSSNGGNVVAVTFNNLSVSGVGSISGTLQETRILSGTTIATVLDTPPAAPGGAAALVITPAAQAFKPCSGSTASYNLSLNALTIDGKANNSLIPQSGMISIGFSSILANACRATTIDLTFTSSSPSTRTVKVSIDDSAPINITFGSL